MMVAISSGNTKIGNTPNISLSRDSCQPGLPCYNTCYAKKAWQMYPEVRKAWSGNWEAYKTNPDEFFSIIDSFLVKNKSKYFRWHVCGDIPDEQYLVKMIDLAKKHSNVIFISSTKQHALIDKLKNNIPANLVMYASMWPNWGNPQQIKDFPKIWMADKENKEDRYNKNIFVCPGYCPSCRHCWKVRTDILIHQH